MAFPSSSFHSITAIDYNQESENLTVDFENGIKIQYSNIPFELAQRFKTAESPKDILDKEIEPNYSSLRIWKNIDELLKVIGQEVFGEDQPILVNHHRLDGDTPLHIAAHWGDIQAIELLLGAGAHINSPGDLRVTPLYNAVLAGHTAAALKLLEKGANPYAKNDLQDTPLECAIRNNMHDFLSAVQKNNSV